VPRRFGPEGLFSHHLYRLRPRAGGPLTAHFLYLLLLTESFRRQVTAHANGTTVNMLPADGLRRPLLAVPPAALVRRFGQVVDPLFEGAEAADEESMSLAALREALLPGLLAGAVRVGEAPLL
jgi:type I restriction enzyme S subunit